MKSHLIFQLFKIFSKLNLVKRNKAVKRNNMTFPIFTGDDFAVIWAHIRNIKDGYFIDIPFIALIVAFIFYFFTRELPTKKLIHFFNRGRNVPVYNPLTDKYRAIIAFCNYS